ncbi:Putative Type IV secretion system protein, TraC-like [Desulfonema limicola]|uniref:Type IV secretion system protein, TraC-like n=1 Tax=Desulfonema limicola TaxID=45656 RepID=A0A975B4B0_9BACT|nr:type IV secretion system protein TraC [Desulfonema limicola]QTA78504.1 Putative Type IV secretion system protein, TraC-like [Desulfonema limicola]
MNWKHKQTGNITGESTVKNLELILNLDLPEDTVIQFILFADPRIQPLLTILAEKGNPGTGGDYRQLTGEWIRRYTAYLNEHSKTGFDRSVPVPVRNFRLYLAVKIPYNDYDATVGLFRDRRDAITGLLNSSGFHPRTGDAGTLLNLVRFCYNPDYSYKNQEYTPYNDHMWIHRQVIRKSTEIEWLKGSGDSLCIDGKQIGVYSVAGYPNELDLFDNLFLLGNIFSRNLEQIVCPFIFSMSFINRDFNDAIRKKSGIMLAQKAAGSMAPKLRKKQEEFLQAVMAIEDNVKFRGVMFSVVLFTDDEEKKAKTESVLKGLWRQKGYDIQEETMIALPVFMSSMPFGLVNHHATRERLKRIDLAPVRTIAEFIPSQADWKGTPDPALFLVSRRGQLIGLDLFSSNTNYNCAISAASGSGKSFFSQYLIISYLRMGATIRIIDVGRSYMKMCKIFNGDYIEFTKDKKANLCINPFSIVADIKQDMQMLLPMLEKMAKPKMGCDDYELSVLREAITRAYEKYGEDTTVAKVSEVLLEKKDERRNNLGQALQNYGPDGEYGRWFEGKSTLKSSDVPLQILELEELNSDKHLRAIVLMYIIYQTTQTMYFGDRHQKKLIIIDEAWDLFGGDEGAGAASFIQTCYRRARKYNGSVITITQSVKDYYMNDSTEAMLANAAFWFFLHQKEEEISQVVADNRLTLSDFMVEYIKSVHTITGKYSEVYIKTDDSGGIGRLFVDPFTYALFTTNPGESQYIYDLLDSGMSVSDAITEAVESDFGRSQKRIGQ